MTKTISRLYDNYSDAQAAVTKLETAGVPHSDISIVANNSGGEKSLTYGKTENYVQSLKMILEDGEEYLFEPMTLAELQTKKSLPTVEGDVYRKIFTLVDKHFEELKAVKPQVSKNSAGYYLWNVYNKEKGTFDLTKLIVGSQGTLGIITEIKLRLVRPKPHARLLVIFLNDMSLLSSIVSTVLGYKPESFESYDDHTFTLAVRLLPQLARRLGASIFSIGWRFLSEIRMVYLGGVPKLVLLAEFAAATEEEALAQAKQAEEALKAYGLQTKITRSEQEAEKYWVVRRESFNLLRQHVSGMRTVPFIDDFIVRPEHLPKFLPQLYALLDRYPLIYTIAGHVGDGDFHIIPLMDMTKRESVDVIKKLGREVYELVFQYKGSMTGEHNDGLIRGPYLSMMYGEKVYSLFQETKEIFDPLGIFNPGKKVNVNMSFALAHMAQTN